MRVRLGLALVVALLALGPATAGAQGDPPCVLRCPNGQSDHLPVHDAPGDTPWSVQATLNGQNVDFSGAQGGTSDGTPSSSPAPSGPVDPNAPPACVPDLSVRVQGQVPLPPIDIQTSPDAEGVVNVPTWFWVAGYHGAWLTTTRYGTQHVCDPAPHDVSVALDLDIWPAAYKWDFGDGHTVSDVCPNSDEPSACSTGLGSPDTSKVAHTYQMSSYQYSNQGGFPVLLSISYRGRITTHAGVLIGTFTIPQLTYAVQLPVREVQSVLVHQ
jgi:hypothetical protein